MTELKSTFEFFSNDFLNVQCQQTFLKASFRQRIPGRSCMRKETSETDIHITYRNCDRRHEWTSLQIKEVEPIQSLQITIFQHYIDELWLKKKHQLRGHQSQILISVAYSTYPNRNQRHQSRYDNRQDLKSFKTV